MVAMGYAAPGEKWASPAFKRGPAPNAIPAPARWGITAGVAQVELVKDDSMCGLPAGPPQVEVHRTSDDQSTAQTVKVPEKMVQPYGHTVPCLEATKLEGTVRGVTVAELEEQLTQKSKAVTEIESLLVAAASRGWAMAEEKHTTSDVSNDARDSHCRQPVVEPGIMSHGKPKMSNRKGGSNKMNKQPQRFQEVGHAPKVLQRATSATAEPTVGSSAGQVVAPVASAAAETEVETPEYQRVLKVPWLFSGNDKDKESIHKQTSPVEPKALAAEACIPKSMGGISVVVRQRTESNFGIKEATNLQATHGVTRDIPAAKHRHT